ncbi:hypothetical protein [Limnoglobus roseus]|uniref:hypothetical protein n=1 Tax=Limnoglobus roseus TaxID=2598579 RepID=UPI0011EB66C5|nr:hypothetical protein [Limnoglobus roseus]
MIPSLIEPPAWLHDLRAGVDPDLLRIVDDVWANRTKFIRWPQKSLIFMPGTVRGKAKFHDYSVPQREQIKAAKIAADARSNGPAIMAYLLAGGERPLRSSGRKGWSIHHIYDGQHPHQDRTSSTRAVITGEYFTEAAGLVAIHPVADALADEVGYFAWLLRYEAYVRFRFDPDGVFISKHPAV